METATDQPLMALEQYLTTAMGASTLTARLESAIALETFLQGGQAIFSVAEAHRNAFEKIWDGYLANPNLFSDYLAALSSAQKKIDKFKTIPETDLRALRAYIRHARASNMETMSELFDPRSWMQVDNSRGQYILPAKEDHYPRPHMRNSTFKPQMSRVALSFFLNVELPKPIALATKQKFNITQFDDHIKERRAAMKRDPRLQAREMFVSWFGDVTPESTRIILAHLFPKSPSFKKYEEPQAADMVEQFIERSAVREAIAQAENQIEIPEIEPAPVETATAPANETALVTDVPAADAPALAPEAEAVTAMDAQGGTSEQDITTGYPNVEPFKKPDPHSPGSGRGIIALRMQDAQFPPREAKVVTINPHAPILGRGRINVTLPVADPPSSKKIAGRFFAVAAFAIAVSTIGLYEPARTASAQTFTSILDKFNGEERRKREQAARDYAQAHKPKPKIADRFGYNPPAIIAVSTQPPGTVTRQDGTMVRPDGVLVRRVKTVVREGHLPN